MQKARSLHSLCFAFLKTHLSKHSIDPQCQRNGAMSINLYSEKVWLGMLFKYKGTRVFKNLKIQGLWQHLDNEKNDQITSGKY